MSYFIDTHCHLNFNTFQDDLEQVLLRAAENNISEIAIPGTDLVSSKSAVSLCSNYPNLYAAVGVHPNDCDSWNETSYEELKKMATNSCVKAIGEIGLDYYRNLTNPDQQKMVFTAQLNLAQELSLPVIIHNRNSIDDLWPMLKEWVSNLRNSDTTEHRTYGVLHSFEGDVVLANEAFDSGFFLGISGPITYKNAKKRREVISQIALESLVLETDAPFLTPHPHRGQRNEPSYIPIIAQEIARIKQIDIDEVQLITSRNAKKLFSLGNKD